MASTGFRASLGLAFFLVTVNTPGCLRAEAHCPNVVLIVIDTLRSDHLSAFGYERPTSPHLTALMDQATVFTRAVSPSSQTVPVIASVLTGLYPSETTVHYYGDKSSFDGVHPWSEVGPYVDASLELLPERLQELGYETAAVVTNPWIREEFGFGQGFDRFVPVDCGDLCDGRDVVDTGLRFVEERGTDKPFFLYLHFMDVHNPYRKPGITEGIFLKEKERQDFYRNGPTPPMTPSDLEAMMALYDEGIFHVDEQIGRFVDRLDALSPPKETLLVVTSDHGDEFDEHGGLGHGTTLYGELTRSFVILRRPSILPAERIDTPVSLTALAPVILAHVNGTASAARARLIEDSRPWLLSELGSIKSVQRDGWKLILDIEEGTPELYHLPTDPGEKKNLAAMNPKVTRQWMRYLSRFVAAAEPPSPDVPNATVDEGLRKKLRALGYVE